jgi:hypothetical protein
MTISLGRGARRVIATSTAGPVRRIAWLMRGAAPSSLIAACDSGHDRDCYAERVRPCDLAGDSPVQRIALGITAPGDRSVERSGGTRARGRVWRNGRRPDGAPHCNAAPRGG